MLNSIEAREAIQALDYPGRGRSPEAMAAYAEYQAQHAAIEAEWREYLRAEYAPDLAPSVESSLFSLAWEHGHASGYSDVENYYQDFAHFADEIVAQYVGTV
jgi:hypothetical protein